MHQPCEHPGHQVGCLPEFYFPSSSMSLAARWHLQAQPLHPSWSEVQRRLASRRVSAEAGLTNNTLTCKGFPFTGRMATLGRAWRGRETPEVPCPHGGDRLWAANPSSIPAKGRDGDTRGAKHEPSTPSHSTLSDPQTAFDPKTTAPRGPVMVLINAKATAFIGGERDAGHRLWGQRTATEASGEARPVPQRHHRVPGTVPRTHKRGSEGPARPVGTPSTDARRACACRVTAHPTAQARRAGLGSITVFSVSLDSYLHLLSPSLAWLACTYFSEGSCTQTFGTRSTEQTLCVSTCPCVSAWVCAPPQTHTLKEITAQLLPSWRHTEKS